jgi:hypothetical protein
MAELTTALVHENEIAKADDFIHGFTSLIRNTAILDRMLVSANIDYVIGGVVFPDSASFGVRVNKLWANGNSLDLPVFLGDTSEAIPLILPLSEDRIDTLQIKCDFEEFDKQRRAFYNPDLTVGQYFVVPTRLRLKTIIQVKQGLEGAGIAPDADAGWVKLAEICLEPGMVTLPEENIKNITAIFQNELNEAWTNQKNRTFNLGSMLDMKTMFAREHNVDGTHRDKVIHAHNVDFGIGADQVNGTKIPLGKDYSEGTDTFDALDSLYETLKKEVLYRRANHAMNQSAIQQINNTINQILTTIDGLMPKAPGDGPVYGGKNKTWVEVESSGGGGHTEDYHELYKVFSKKTLMVTNRRIVDRRFVGWDIGLPYLTAGSRVYHFDTDLKDHKQDSNISLLYPGDPPALKDRTDTNGEIFFNPAVIDKVPYEMIGRSLHGLFSLSTQLPAMPVFTYEAWVRFFYENNAVILRLASATESIVFKLAIEDPEYSVADVDGIEYSVADVDGIPYSVPGVVMSDSMVYSVADTDGIAYDVPDTDGIPYSIASISGGNSVTHTWSGGTETRFLDDLGFIIASKTWLHIAVVSTSSTLSLFIGKSRVDFLKQDGAAQQMTLTLNEGQTEFNIDEFSINPGAAVNFSEFSDNTDNRIPYAALDYRQKWFVLEAQDPALIKTNLFESEQFRTAVQAVIDSQ